MSFRKAEERRWSSAAKILLLLVVLFCFNNLSVVVGHDDDFHKTENENSGDKNNSDNTSTKSNQSSSKADDQPQKKKKLPHILMIVMDDLGSHDLGMHGTGIYTPNTDQLATDGLYLQNYYVLPYCSPTRAALLSGRYPLHTGVQNWIPPKSTAGLPLEDKTLADMLSSNYSTHAVGKWHIGHSSWDQTPTFRGFSTFFGFYTGGEDYFQHTSGGAYDLRYDTQYYCDETCSQIVDERGNYSTHVFTREAIHVIEEYAAGKFSSSNENRQDQEQQQEASKPLFLYLAYQAVHCPNEVPQEYIDPRYTNRTDWTDRRKNYAGMLTAADEGIGNVTSALKTAGLWEDTLVIYTTDNGGPIVGGCAQGSSNHPKRGGKTTVWEGGITGDAFLSGPALSSIANLPTKTRFPHLFHVVDWLPTISELTGLVSPSEGRTLDGISQLQSLRHGFSSRNEIWLGYAYADSTQSWYGPAIRYRNWKLIQGVYGGPDQRDEKTPGSELPLPGGLSNSTYWLFDLETDPIEETNLVKQYPDIAQNLMYKLREYQQSCVPFQPTDDSACPFTGFVNTTVGPTWMPWCKRGPVESSSSVA